MGDRVYIRKAQEKDLSGLLQLIKELAIFEKEPDAVTVSQSEFRETGFGQHPIWWAFVAEIPIRGETEKKVIGMALYYIRYSTWKGAMLYLEDIIINHHHRGQGIGKLLIEELKKEAKASGLKGVCWQVLDWNEEAIGFYKSIPGISFSDNWINVQTSCT